MTWDESPWAHSLTEFGFDTLKVVAGHVAPQKYHDWIGFRVAEPALRRAFKRTYAGLEFGDQILKRASRPCLLPPISKPNYSGNERGGVSAQEEATRRARLGIPSRAALPPVTQKLRSLAEDLYKTGTGG